MKCVPIQWRSRAAKRGAVAALLASIALQPACAQSADPALAAEVRLLVKQGTISAANGEAMMAQLAADAAQARANAAWVAATGNAPAPNDGVSDLLAQQRASAPLRATRPTGSPLSPPVRTAQADPARAATRSAPPPQPEYAADLPAAPPPPVAPPPPPTVSAALGLPPAPAGTIRVPYVPETVRKQIVDQVRGEVMQQARSEGWAAPGDASPDWVRKIKVSGSIRVRSESDLYGKDNADDIIDFTRFNNTGPLDTRNPTLVLPYVNTRQDRLNQFRLRAMLDVDANIDPHVKAAIRLATGEDNGPISTNQALAGGFAKRSIWLDRAYVTVSPTPWAGLTFGRMPNPFRSTDLLFDTDLNFDGIAVYLDAKPLLGDKMFVRAHAGAFPLDFGSPNFPDTVRDKRDFPQKWLYSGQLELGGTLGKFDFAASGAYHYFQNVQGQLSDPCDVYLGVQECTTDNSRPFFLRQGNTLFFIRQNTADPALPANATQPNPQFVGLTFGYHVLDVTAAASLKVSKNIRVTVDGDYIRNLDYHRSDICRYAALGSLVGSPLNNVVEAADGNPDVCSGPNPATFAGGRYGFMARTTVGYRNPRKWGEWSVEASYRYLQSDATLDSFTDSDFHLGGTNTKGYTIGGTLGLFNGVTVGGRWMSANEVSGRNLGIDVLQLDLSAAF